jgi:hypothetical protein
MRRTFARRSVQLAAAAGLVLSALGGPRRADAQQPPPIEVTFDSARGTQYAQQLGLDVELLKTRVREEIGRAFQLYRLDDYLRSFGDAQAFTTKGLGVDYASDLQYVMIGVAANVALDADRAFVERESESQPEIEGLSPNLTFMAGVNLGLLGLRPVTLFGNYFRGSGTYREFTTDLDNYGVHVQLRFFGPGRERVWNALARWGGVDVTTGFDYAHQRLTLARDQRLDSRLVVQGTSYQGDVSLQGMGTFRLDMRTWSIPLEVTTSLRLLYALSLYGGLGFDWQLGGGADMTIDVSGRMSGSIPELGVTQEDLGTARVTVADSAACRPTSSWCASSPRSTPRRIPVPSASRSGGGSRTEQRPGPRRETIGPGG